MKVALVRIEGSYQEAVDKVKQLTQEGVVALIVDARHSEEIIQLLTSRRTAPAPLE